MGCFFFFYLCVGARTRKTLLALQIKRKKESSELSEIHIDRLETLDHLMAVLQLANDAQQHHQH